MEICKTDFLRVCQYLDDAATIICVTCNSTRWTNRARLMRILARKLRQKAENGE